MLAQEGVDITLRISDDNSSDSTYEICRNYKLADSRVSIKLNMPGLGVALNFMSMLYEANAEDYDYFAFSDQDDYWLPQKLATAISKITENEKGEFSKKLLEFGTPVLYCSELLNVDSNLRNPVPELANLQIDLSKRATPLIRNFFSGCTMVMNRAMLKLIQSYKCTQYPRIHDAWCAMIAYYCGNFTVDFESPLILRRNTGLNQVGAFYPGKDIEKASVFHLKDQPKHDRVESANLLLEGYSNYMTEDDRELVKGFVGYNESLNSRVRWAVSKKYQKATMKETLLDRAKFLLGRI